MAVVPGFIASFFRFLDIEMRPFHPARESDYGIITLPEIPLSRSAEDLLELFATEVCLKASDTVRVDQADAHDLYKQRRSRGSSDDRTRVNSIPIPRISREMVLLTREHRSISVFKDFGVRFGRQSRRTNEVAPAARADQALSSEKCPEADFELA